MIWDSMIVKSSDVNKIAKTCCDSNNLLSTPNERIMTRYYKRTLEIANNPYHLSKFISGSSIKNYMLNDPLIDWLDQYYSRKCITKKRKYDDDNICDIDINSEIDKEKKKISILLQNGVTFENKVFDDIKNKFNTNAIQIAYSRKDYTKEKYDETLHHMKTGTPIIIQGIVYNMNNMTCGMIDLLIRSDYINKLITQNQLTENEINIKAPLLNHNFHYRVIDIKWTTLHLCSNGKLLRNTERIPAYKGQLAIYNCAVGHMQGYFPSKTYIMGHSWKYELRNKIYRGHSCYDLLGHIDYEDFDNSYIEKTKNAIEWVKLVREKGHNWMSPFDGYEDDKNIMINMMPNMSNSFDGHWRKVKNILAKQKHELTSLWMVGAKNRYIAISNGIYKWSDDNCTASKLGIKDNTKVGNIINLMIDINKNNNDNILPKKIKNNEKEWQSQNYNDFYIDFETVNGCFSEPIENIDINNSKYESVIIFMIGCGHIKNNTFVYKSFIAESITPASEKKIIMDWMNYVKSISKNPRFIHWSDAELTALGIANIRCNNEDFIDNVTWIDLYKIFVNEPIIIKGSMSYKLKNIAKSMKQMNMINITWDNDITDGLTAMMSAVEYYKNNDKKIMDEIEEYNKVDCEVMCEIITYLRKYHT